jgi:hypothetical protein
LVEPPYIEGTLRVFGSEYFSQIFRFNGRGDFEDREVRNIIVLGIIVGMVLASLWGCIMVPCHFDGGGRYGPGAYRSDYYGYDSYRGRGDYYRYGR